MSLPFEPQPLDKLRARFPAAVGRVFDYRSGFPAAWPGRLRANVFGFEDGVRMIVSRDMEADGRVSLHVSASAEPGFPVYGQIARGETDVSRFRRMILERYAQLSGDTAGLDFCGLSPGKGIPHWRRLEL
jgi:hypothetical protein